MNKKQSKQNIPPQEESKQDKQDDEEDMKDGENREPAEPVEEQQEHNEESVKSWNLNDKEIKVLSQIQREVEETLKLASQLEQQSIEVDPVFDERANKSIQAVNNVVEAMKEEFSKNEADDEIKQAVENTILRLSTKNKRLEEEKDNLKELVKQRNEQVRMLVLRVKQMESILFDKDNQIERLEQQLQHLNRNVNKLQSKVDDEYRTQLIQEQLRQPKDKQSIAQQQYQSILNKEQKMPLFLSLDQSKYLDANVKEEGGGFDFWKSDGQQPAAEYPGNPKRLHDVINQKNLWVGQNEDDLLKKFQFQRSNNRVTKKKDQDFWQG